jgi:hypothetical protein
MNNKTTKLTGTKKTTRTTTTVTKYSDAQQTIKNIDAKLEQVRAVFGRPFRTNGESKTTTVNPTNLNVRAATNIALLIAILGEITAKGEQYNKATTMLGLTQYPSFNWQGYSYESWLFDIKLRIEQINQVTTENELLAIRNDLQEFVTKEDKLSMLQERMAKLGI